MRAHSTGIEALSEGLSVTLAQVWFARFLPHCLQLAKLNLTQCADWYLATEALRRIKVS